MISLDKEKMIRKLISRGMKFGMIAAKVGVDRKLVRVISKLSDVRERKIPKRRVASEVIERLQEKRRCPTCGGMVFLWPCILCNPQVGCY